jgi:hypothetical protein
MLPLVGWSKKYLSINYCDFLTPTDAVTENAQKYLAAERGFYGTFKDVRIILNMV